MILILTWWSYCYCGRKATATSKRDTYTLASHQPSNTDMIAHTMPETDVVKESTNDETDHVSADNVNLSIDTVPLRSTAQTHGTLPKLTPPTFSGNPLKWQTFWDLFDTAVLLELTG